MSYPEALPQRKRLGFVVRSSGLELRLPIQCPVLTVRADDGNSSEFEKVHCGLPVFQARLDNTMHYRVGIWRNH